MYSNRGRKKFDTDGFSGAFDAEIVNFDIRYIGIDSVFYDYIENNNKYKMNKDKLMNQIYKIINDRIEIKCDDDYILDKFEAVVSSEDDLWDFYHKHEIDYTREDELEDRYSKLEREVFDKD